MKKQLTITGDAMTIDMKINALKQLEQYDVTTLNNITKLLKTEKARTKFNKNVHKLKMFI